MKRIKRTIAPFTLAGLLGVQSLIVPVSVEAAPVSAGKFSDVAKNHWATPYITKMSLRNVVAGYEDGTFKPEQKVTQLQAVALAVRNMGLADEAEKYKNTAIPYTVPTWAKGSVALAISKGLIKPSEKNFSPNEYASRAWIAQLMVRMVGKESEVGKSVETTVFTDAADVPEWAKEYVKTASSLGLVSGYLENGKYSFKPNYAVTRAQIVSVLSQSEKYIDVTSDTTQVGSVESITGSTLSIINSAGGKQSYTLTSQTKFYKDSKEITSAVVDADSQVMVIGTNGKADYVEVLQNKPAKPQYTTVKGTIEKVFSEAKTVVVRLSDDKLQTYTISDSTAVTSGSDKLQVSQLVKGDQVELSINADGKVVELKRTNVSQEQAMAGTVYDIDKATQLLTIKTAAGKLEAYQYTDATYIEYKNKRFPSVEDLLPGDSVKLEVNNGAITKIIVAGSTANAGETATVKVISAADKFIALQNDKGDMQAYTIASSATVSLNGAIAPTLADIKVGDKVEVKVENNAVVSIAIKNRTVKGSNDLLSGSVFALDTTNRVLSLKSSNGELRAYEVLPTAQVLLNGNSKNLTDIKKDMTVSIQLNEDNKIISINADNRLRAEVVYVNTDDRLLTVKLETGETKVYVVDRNVDITIYDVSGEELRDLRAGDKIAMKMDTSKITTIDVEKTYVYRATENNSSYTTRITAQNEQGRSRDLTVDGGVTLTIPGIPYPKVSDVKKGDVLRVTYLGNTLKSVAVVPSIYGQVTQVTPETNKVVVKDLNGVTNELTLGYGSSIQIGDRTYTNLTSLVPGNRVQVAEAANGAKSIIVLSKVETTFTSLDPLGDRIYTAKSSYYLPDSLFNRQTQLQTLLNSLRKNDKVALYFLNNELYEIARNE
ncbi:S-layer homology domain-containing protein [Aneurinibacillus uraniidurans]|uniref:S-layer homology domain-containing protein n=1 Tax=Aneurinibacillus uraniidurans TaxID=2966586 RepID=UPI00234A1C76|nr:S-layer homology domain-containing protein [Aneurinibacillus sp. B1]WCN37928.1 S-layer homology domain-containing protein [Aneurinibacillus sp. B1]